jgi:cell division protein FtsA
MAKNFLAVLEIGTTRTVLLIGEPIEGRRVNVLGRGIARTTGVRKGSIIELKQAQAGVETALHLAEDAANVTVGEVMLVVSGAHILTSPGEGSLPVRAADGKVTRDDMDEVRELAHASRPDGDRAVLHALPQFYRLGDLDDIVNPEGMRGKQLRLGTIFVHGQRDRIDDAVNLLKNITLDTRDIAFSGLTAGTAVLTPEQRNHGVLLVDLGGGTTNYVVFVRNTVIAAGSMGVGGDHVTNDIAQAFGIGVSQAEDLKLSDGCAVIDPDRSGRRVELQSGVTSGSVRSVSVKALHTVMEARMRETLELVREQVGPELRQVGSGVVFTGGGAYLPRIEDLAQRVFGMRSWIGEPLPQYIENLRDDRVKPASLAAVAGLLIRGAQSQEEDRVLGPVSTLFGRLKGGFRR